MLYCKDLVGCEVAYYIVKICWNSVVEWNNVKIWSDYADEWHLEGLYRCILWYYAILLLSMPMTFSVQLQFHCLKPLKCLSPDLQHPGQQSESLTDFWPQRLQIGTEVAYWTICSSPHSSLFRASVSEYCNTPRDNPQLSWTVQCTLVILTVQANKQNKSSSNKT